MIGTSAGGIGGSTRGEFFYWAPWREGMRGDGVVDREGGVWFIFFYHGMCYFNLFLIVFYAKGVLFGYYVTNY